MLPTARANLVSDSFLMHFSNHIPSESVRQVEPYMTLLCFDDVRKAFQFATRQKKTSVQDDCFLEKCYPIFLTASQCIS